MNDVKKNEIKFPKFIVMDIIFKGRSLNYDQGAGNYQELKKITKFDGKQYTMVSRYALRYSILQTGKRMGFWDFYDDFENGKENKSVLQGNKNDLFIGKLLMYPEFDLFGFMITTSKNKNSGNKNESGVSFSKESPVKITHAVSLTPFNFDTHLSGNHWVAQRAYYRGKLDKMDINIFTREEHDTFYGYTVAIDVNRIGEYTIYAPESLLKKFLDEKYKEDANKSKEKGKNKEDIMKELENFLKEHEIDGINIEKDKLDKVIKIKYKLTDSKKEIRIKNLIQAILNATREIKGSTSSLKPYILVLGLYKDSYDTQLDRIKLEREYQQVKEVIKIPVDKNDPSKGEKIIERVKVTNNPKFRFEGNIDVVEFKDVSDLWEKINGKHGVFNQKHDRNISILFKMKGVDLEVVS